MKRGRMIGLIVLLGVVLLGSYLASISSWKERKLPTPLGGDAAINPFYAAQKLVGELGARTEWRRSLGQLTAADHALVLTAWHWAISEPRRKAIERWVENGGRLAVDSSLLGFDELRRWTGIEYRYPDDANDESEAPPDCRSFEQRGRAGKPDMSAGNLVVCGLDPYGRFESNERIQWGLADEAGLQVVRVAVGKGSVTIVDGTPFTWRSPQLHDHAKLLVRALDLRKGERVVFVSADREQNLLQLIWRHGAPAVLLGLFALVLALWRGAISIGPRVAEPHPARRSLDEQIQGTGNFLLRTRGAPVLFTAVSDALERAAARQVRGWAGLGESDRQAALTSLTGIERNRIAAARDWPRHARKHELASAIACLESTRRLLVAQQSNKHDSSGRVQSA